MTASTRKRFTSAAAVGGALLVLVLAPIALGSIQREPGSQGERGAAGAALDLRRDPQAAEPFAAEAVRTAPPRVAAGEGFHVSDAAIGAGAALALVGIGMAASGAWRRRPHPRASAEVAGVG